MKVGSYRTYQDF